jgi:glycosyltransferase involved in cell wall biosynthesis
MSQQSHQKRLDWRAADTIHFVANCVYGDHLGGGDIHFFHMAQSANGAGYKIHFFGGQALKQHLEKLRIANEQTCTDSKKLGAINMESLPAQFRLLFNYLGRFWRTLRKLSEIQPDDIAYAVTDYWFDALPVIFSRAGRKMMILGMDAPTFAEIVFRRRPDVPPHRLNSIYHWLSQSLSLRLFRFCRHKRLLYVHPNMKPRLLRLGYNESELIFVSNGFDLEAAEKTPAQTNDYDAMWIGRLHRQKGIDDLLATLVSLSKRINDFRAVLAGRLEELKPKLAELGLTEHVRLAGLVSESEKFRLFKASRVFLMPSRYESWGIVVAESLACSTPVVAYELDAYRPIFGDLVRYIKPFDVEAFKAAAADEIEKSRAGTSGLDPAKLELFKQENSWQAAGERFLDVVRGLEGAKD